MLNIFQINILGRQETHLWQTDSTYPFIILYYFRYKIVCIVGIVEKRSQGVISKVKFLRDITKDKYVKTKFENNNLVATIVVGALYFE